MLINEDLQVNASIKTHNIQKIYETTRKFVINKQNNNSKSAEEIEKEKLDNLLNRKEENKKEEEIIYNIPLLNYSCVLEADKEFAKFLITSRWICNRNNIYLFYNANIYNI
ncbi:MAG: hypothetical protein HFJ50_09915 [Clostridia bacterium]|jgi:hypothetical protein|nr:hypothetical protein [Clostridia bacterium]